MRTAVAAFIALLVPALAWSQEAVLPNGQIASNGNNCAVNAHLTLDDDPQSPGGDWCTATLCGGNPTPDTSWHLNLATPSGNPSTATDAQVFRAYVRSCASGGSDPACRIDVYCNGTLNSTGGDTTITSSTGQLISRTWTMDTGSCAANGSDVEALLFCTSSGGTPSGRRAADADAVRWTATIASASRRVIVVSK